MRFTVAVVAMLAVLATLTVTLLYRGLIRFNHPPLADFPAQDIDVSHRQGEIDWPEDWVSARSRKADMTPRIGKYEWVAFGASAVLRLANVALWLTSIVSPESLSVVPECVAILQGSGQSVSRSSASQKMLPWPATCLHGS